MKNITITNINANTGNITFDVAFDSGTKTFTVNGLPIVGTKQELLDAITEYVKAYVRGRRGEKAAKQTATAEITAIVNTPQGIDLGEEDE